MSTGDYESEEAGAAVSVGGEPHEEAAKRRLEIGVDIADVGPCKKHLRISIPRAEIERQFEESLSDLRKEAVVPGFRPGRAPRQLVVKRFRKEVSQQVKSALLMSSLEQIDKEYHLDPITQPRLDVGAIELPDDGPMNFEMDVEVRPQFDAPQYSGLKLKRPVRDITEPDVDVQLTRFLERHGQVVPKLEGAAEIGDYVTADLSFSRPDGQPLNEVKEIQFRLQPELRFQDGYIAGMGAALAGAKPGDTRQVQANLGTSVNDPSLRGATVPVQVKVNDLKQLRLPEVNQDFLNSIEFSSVDELRDAVRAALKRRVESQQRQALRAQVLDALLRATPFELPPDLVSREERNTIQRLVMELRQQGMSDQEIRAREAQIRANAHESTLRSLKEFLLLAKIADAEGIKVEDEDLAIEIESIAERTGETTRRVRARIEKEGMSEPLLTQILERKVLDHILGNVEIEDVAQTAAESEGEGLVETVDHSATPPGDQSQSAEGAAGETENQDAS